MVLVYLYIYIYIYIYIYELWSEDILIKLKKLISPCIYIKYGLKIF